MVSMLLFECFHFTASSTSSTTARHPSERGDQQSKLNTVVCNPEKQVFERGGMKEAMRKALICCSFREFEEFKPCRW